MMKADIHVLALIGVYLNDLLEEYNAKVTPWSNKILRYL